MYHEQQKTAELEKKVIPQTKKADFEEFWKTQVEALRKIPLQYTREKLDLPYEKTFLSYKITYNTHDDTMVDAYFSCPVNSEGKKLPCVVRYHGGSGHKEIYADIVATGVCCLAIDVRSQGGTTVDKAVYHSGDRNGGLMTRGVLDKNEFYMRNIYLDAVRAVDLAAILPEVDPERIVTYGGSQGGALSIVASALSGRSKKCYAVVTSYGCLHRRVESPDRPKSGIFDSTHQFLRNYPEHTDTVMDTLTYFDVNNMVSMLNVPISFCLGLTDPICLPEYVYSVYAHTPVEKELHMYPFVPHSLPEAYKLMAYREFAAL